MRALELDEHELANARARNKERLALTSPKRGRPAKAQAAAVKEAEVVEHEVQGGKLAIYTRSELEPTGQRRERGQSYRREREYSAYIRRIVKGRATIEYHDDGGAIVTRFNVPLSKLRPVGDRLD